MRCEEIMKRNPECLAPSDSVQLAASKMRDANVGFLPVCDSGRHPLGTITDRDIAIRLVADAGSSDTAVSQIMTAEVVACRPSSELTEATQLMRENHKSRILCCDEAGRLVGVISLSDIAQVAADESAMTLRDVSEREAQT